MWSYYLYGFVPEKILRLVYEPWSPTAPPKAGKAFYLAIYSCTATASAFPAACCRELPFVTFYEIIMLDLAKKSIILTCCVLYVIFF